MTVLGRSRTAVLAIAVSWALIPAIAHCQKPAPAVNPKDTAKTVDWNTLRGPLDAGDYVKAKAAAAAILELVIPDRKAPDFISRCVDTIDALMRRGFCEWQLGELDAADATFLAAETVLKEREFRKQLEALEKQGGAKVVDALIDLDLRLIEIHNLRAAVFLERIRRAHADGAPSNAAADPPSTLPESVRGWVDIIRSLVNGTADARKKLGEKFEEGGNSITGSPHKKALMSRFHPELIAGIVAFEASSLPFSVPAAPDVASSAKATSAPDLFVLEGLGRRELVSKSLGHFENASKALHEVFEATIAQGLAKAPGEKRLEANVLLIQLSLARCAALLKSGDLSGARKDIDEVFRLHKDLASLRKIEKPEVHPELYLPLLLATEIELAQADQQFKAGMIDEARIEASRAAELLKRASALPGSEMHARRSDLSRLATTARKQQERFDASVVTTDAAEVAARRIRRAVERTAPIP